MISIKVAGLEGVQDRLRQLASDLEEGRAMQAAINKTAAKAQAEINRAIRDEYAVSPEEVRNAISLQRAKSGSLRAVIDIFGSKNRRGRSLNMIHFLTAMQAAGMAIKTRGAVGIKRRDLKALGKQLGFRIKKGGGLKQIDGAFVGNKGRTVFMREGKGRLPIKPVQVIGFSQMFQSRKIHDRVLDKIRADFVVEVERAVRMVIARRGQ